MRHLWENSGKIKTIFTTSDIIDKDPFLNNYRISYWVDYTDFEIIKISKDGIQYNFQLSEHYYDDSISEKIDLQYSNLSAPQRTELLMIDALWNLYSKSGKAKTKFPGKIIIEEEPRLSEKRLMVWRELEDFTKINVTKEKHQYLYQLSELDTDFTKDEVFDDAGYVKTEELLIYTIHVLRDDSRKVNNEKTKFSTFNIQLKEPRLTNKRLDIWLKHTDWKSVILIKEGNENYYQLREDVNKASINKLINLAKMTAAQRTGVLIADTLRELWNKSGKTRTLFTKKEIQDNDKNITKDKFLDWIRINDNSIINTINYSATDIKFYQLKTLQPFETKRDKYISPDGRIELLVADTIFKLSKQSNSTTFSTADIHNEQPSLSIERILDLSKNTNLTLINIIKKSGKENFYQLTNEYNQIKNQI